MPAVKATLVGLKKLDEAIKRAELRTRAAARTAVDETSRRTQLAIRKDVNRIFSGGTIRQRRGKGRRVGNAVRRKLFDNRARGTAALVFSKFGRREGGEFVDYLGPYITGRDIRPKRGRYLVVPLQRGKRNRDPRNIKNLHTVSVAGRLYLVRSTRTRTTFMFLLIPRVRITKRLRAGQIARQEARAMSGRTKRAFRF